MAKLHFLLDGNLLGEFALDQERMTIGRRPNNQIHIDNLAVSGVHAVIVTIGNDSFLEDLNSTNGTMLNGKNIKKHVLQHDDVIEFGKYQLKYINQNQTSYADDAFEKTIMIRPIQDTASTAKSSVGEKRTAKKVAVPADDEDAKAAMQADKVQTASVQTIARLQVLNGASAGRELTLNKTMTTLGKPGAQVAVITKRPHGYFITHVGGSNLPTVNGETIGLQAHALNNHDVIELASTKMEFHLS